jgi:hypothetical protein
MTRRRIPFLLPSSSLITLLYLAAASTATAVIALPADVPPAQKNRDWTKYPAVVQLDTSEDIFVIGAP